MSEAELVATIARLERALADARANEKAARDAADRAVRARESLLAKLGHDVRNPLGAIAAATEVLARIGSDNPDETRARDVIRRQLRQLTTIVEQMLDTSRVLNGAVPLTRAPMDLAAAARRVIDALTAASVLSQHTVQATLQPAWISGDPPRIEQAIAQLVANAAKFSPAGSTIDVHVAPDGAGTATLTVTDRGAGIATSDLERVFTPFELDEPRVAGRRRGLGAGLALARTLITLHGGTVTASSEGLDRGSRFEMRLPSAAPPGHA